MRHLPQMRWTNLREPFRICNFCINVGSRADQAIALANVAFARVCSHLRHIQLDIGGVSILANFTHVLRPRLRKEAVFRGFSPQLLRLVILT